MEGEKLTPIAAWELPYSKKANLKDVEFDAGMHLLRITIREGTRITLANMDAAVAREMGEAMIKWADEHAE